MCAVSRWLRWSLVCRLGRIADLHTRGTQHEHTDSKQDPLGNRDGNHTPTLLDSPTSTLYGHSDVSAGPPKWWHAGRFAVASTVQYIGDCLVGTRKSRNLSQILLAYGAALWARFEQRNAHHRLVKKGEEEASTVSYVEILEDNFGDELEGFVLSG
jgi:hypothetical protein